MTSFYREDLAYIHHTGFGDFARKAAPELLRLLQQRQNLQAGLVLDLGCGSGIWAQALTGAGYEVLGLDLSPAMIKLARKNAPQARFQLGSLFRAKLPQCIAITVLGEGLNYQFDRHDRRDLQNFFARAYHALQPGGVLVFDILEPGSLEDENPQRTYAEGEDWAILLEKKEDRRSAVLTRTMTIFRQVGKQYRRSAEVHCVRLYRGSELAHELRRIGFKVRLLRGYGELRFRKGVVGIWASKP